MRTERIYALLPVDGRKSFYNKAYVHVDDDGETLYSYGTKIMVRKPDGSFARYWGGWTVTTGRHIKAFSGLNKVGYDALPMEE